MGVPRCRVLGVMEVLGALGVQILGSGVAGCWGCPGAGSAGGAEWVQLPCSDGDAVLRLQWVQVVVSQLSQVVPLLNPVPDLLQLPLEGPDEPPGFCLCEPLLGVLSQEPLEGTRTWTLQLQALSAVGGFSGTLVAVEQW